MRREAPEPRYLLSATNDKNRCVTHRLMRMLGAKVIVTPKAGKGLGMVRKAEELCAKHGWSEVASVNTSMDALFVNFEGC